MAVERSRSDLVKHRCSRALSSPGYWVSVIRSGATRQAALETSNGTQYPSAATHSQESGVTQWLRVADDYATGVYGRKVNRGLVRRADLGAVARLIRDWDSEAGIYEVEGPCESQRSGGMPGHSEAHRVGTVVARFEYRYGAGSRAYSLRACGRRRRDAARQPITDSRAVDRVGWCVVMCSPESAVLAGRLLGCCWVGLSKRPECCTDLSREQFGF
jgi:hypothetical protein